MAKPTKKDSAREKFEAGSLDAWSAGDWGAVVRVFAEKGKLKIRHQKPGTKKPTQKTLFAHDTPELRRKATAVAVKVSERLRAGEIEPAPKPQEQKAEEITVRGVCLLYMRRFPGFTEKLFAMTKHELEQWYDALPRAVRDAETTPAFATLFSDVYAFRRLWTDDRFRADRRVLDLEPAEANAYAAEYIASGGSPRTCAADLDKLSCAIRYVIMNHRRTVGLAINPIEGRKVDRSKAKIPAYTKPEVVKMRAKAPELAARDHRPIWQVFVAGGIASSGRRLGSIVGLTANDHDFRRGTVTWRAQVAKGGNYGRGDEVRPMTALHRSMVEWAIKHYPNPLGADHPLLWKQRNPELPVPESTIWKQLWILEEASGVPHLDGRAWHSFRRMMATLLADEVGDGPAAEFIGMTVETLRRYNYKQVQPDTMSRVAGAADDLLRER